VCLIDERITYVIAFRTVNSIYNARARGSGKEAFYSYGKLRASLPIDFQIARGIRHHPITSSRALHFARASARGFRGPTSARNNIDREIPHVEEWRRVTDNFHDLALGSSETARHSY
jgi:hypothetical protein